MKTYVRYIIYAVLAVVVPMGVNLQAQTVSQKGVSYRYNGKNKRTPLGGVYIKAMASNGGEVSDDKNGTFTLELKDLKMGSMIGKVRVTKQGMMVFNQQAVDDWTVRKEPLCLILCDANEFQKQKDNLIATGRNQAKKKYDQKLAELKKQNDEQELKIDIYYNKLDSLEKEFQNAMQNMDKYADVFARIDESEVDTVAQRAIELFNRGEIEESLRLLEEQNYMEKIKKANRTIAQAEELVSTAEQAKALAEQDKEKALEGIKTQIAAYKLQYEWDKAGKLMKGLADYVNTVEANLDYARFCYKSHYYYVAEKYYLKSKDQINQSGKKWQSAKIQVEIAFLYRDMESFFRDKKYSLKSESMFKSALEIYQNLFFNAMFPSLYVYKLAKVQEYLAILYQDQRRHDDCEAMYKAAVETYKYFIKSNPEEINSLPLVEKKLAEVQTKLALQYKHWHLHDKSEAMYNEAIKTCEHIEKGYDVESFDWEPEMARAKHGLALLYEEMKRYDLAYVLTKKLIVLFKEKINQGAFWWDDTYPWLLDSQSFYANLLGKFKEGEKYSLGALKVNPTLWSAYIKLAPALLLQGKVKEAEELYRKYKVDFKDAFLDDFAEFERLGIIPEERKADVERIKAMLNEE